MATTTTQRSIRAVFGQQQQSKRVPVTQKDDKYMQHGQLLLAVQQSPVPLERLLAVAKLAITFLTDLLRPSNDTQDTPILILGHHYVSHRLLGEGTATTIPGTAAAPAAPAAAAGPATSPATPAAAGAAAAAASGTGGGSTYAAHLQEICTFDADEGPKSFTGVEGVPLALLDLSLAPLAVAKSKRLGRELSIKVNLNPSSGGSLLQLLSWGEEYSLAWPGLQLLAPTSPRCPVVFKGELAISCRASGLLMSLSFAKDCSVKGTIEQLPGSTPAAAAAAMAAAAAAGGTGSKSQLLGTVAGHWTSAINVSCPKLGLEGVLYDNAAVSPAPLAQLDLAHLGPMKMSRVWSAIHDALLYADPRVAAGGRAASKLALTMSHYLKALTLDSATSRDVAPSAMAAAQGASSTAAAAAASSRAASSGGALSSAVSTADTDADLEEFDRSVEGRSKDTEDTRAVPPCYKAQHAEGHKLKYVLHCSLTSSPSSTAAA